MATNTIFSVIIIANAALSLDASHTAV